MNLHFQSLCRVSLLLSMLAPCLSQAGASDALKAFYASHPELDNSRPADAHRLRPDGDDTTLRALCSSNPGLRFLTLDNTQVTEEGYAQLKAFHRLELVRLFSNHATDFTMAEVAQCRQLRQVWVGSSNITDRGVETLTALPQLEDLSLSSAKIGKPGLTAIARAKAVRRLLLTGCVLNGPVLDGLANSAVETLLITRCSKGPIVTRQAPKGLLSLNLYETKTTDEEIRSILALCPSLTSLNIGRTGVTSAVIKDVFACPHLESLGLDGLPLDDKQVLTGLSEASSLRSLDLSHTSISDECLSSLLMLANLEHLDVSNTKISNRGVEIVSRIGTLRELALNNTLVTDDAVPHLARLEQLESLQMSGTKLRGRTLKALRGLKHLQRVEVYRTPVTHVRAQELHRVKGPWVIGFDTD